ncbi:MAG: cation diffusion facilitator family transporter, partial [Anaerovoracaceae bacterium]
GVNNLADASSSVITLVGFKLASQPEDEDHPYGHARYEYLTGLFIAVFIIIVGCLLLQSSIDKIIDPVAIEVNYITIVILVLAIFFKLWQMAFYVKVGGLINSLALKATATDSRNDVITTSVVLLSVIIAKFSGFQLDGYFGGAVALFIIWSGIQLVRETISPLLGEAPSEELVQQICEIIEANKGVLGVHDLIVHNYGPGKVFASAHIEVDSKVPVMESHDMVDRIETEVMHKLRIQFVAHMDPLELDNPLINEVIPIIKEAIADLEGVKEFHDLRVVAGNTHSNLIFDLVLSPDNKLSKNEIRDAILREIKKVDNNLYIVINFDQSFH